MRELESALGGRGLGGGPSLGVQGASVDTRTLRPGEVFFAIRGERQDGHAFVEEAFRKGAALAVVRRGFPAGGPVIWVENPRRALGAFAAYHLWGLKGLRVVALTGSVGKTTAKEMIYQVLSRRLRGKRSPKSFNNDIGVPFTALMAEPKDHFLVAEVGTNHPGEIRPLAEILRPHVGVLTRIGRSHLEFFGSAEAVAREKAELFRAIRPGGAAVLNADSPYLDQVRAAVPERVRVLTYGLEKPADFRPEAVELGLERVRFRLRGVDFRIPVPGRGVVENALAAVVVGHLFGLPLEEMAEALASFRPPAMRKERLRINGIEVINDAYNANPDSTEELLATFRAYPGRRILVMGEMLELGELAGPLHREVGRKAAEWGYLLVAVGPRAADLLRGYREAEGEKAWAVEKVEELIPLLRKVLRAGDLVLFKASRAVGLDRAVAMLQDSLQGERRRG